MHIEVVFMTILCSVGVKQRVIIVKCGYKYVYTDKIH